MNRKLIGVIFTLKIDNEVDVSDTRIVYLIICFFMFYFRLYKNYGKANYMKETQL